MAKDQEFKDGIKKVLDTVYALSKEQNVTYEQVKEKFASEMLAAVKDYIKSHVVSFDPNLIAVTGANSGGPVASVNPAKITGGKLS